MGLGRLLAHRKPRAWFQLDQLLESVLADVISADANFQLSQTLAWRQFGEALAEFGRIPTVERVDLGVGFGRLENLGLSELSVSLPLEVYQPGWVRRFWWGIIKLFGASVPEKDQRYRLAPPGIRPVLELQIKARRDAQGRWTVDQEQQAQETESQGAAQ